MAKNITILEGRETRTFGNVQKLETNLAGENGTCTWIPEDEAAEYVDADVLEVDENGYYEPEAGTFYNGVDVNVETEPDLEEITITENGTYTPSGDGFSSVSVEVDTSGQEGDPEVHGNEVTAIAQTDINAGDTVAVQSDSDEPISVACPMSGIASNSNPSAFDGKYLYWNAGQYYASEVRKKPISNMESESYTVVASKPAGDTSYYNPWLYEYRLTNGFINGNAAYQTIFTNKKEPTGGSVNTVYGRYHAIGDGKGMYDHRMKLVNQNVPSWAYGNGGYAISSSRMIYKWNGAGETNYSDGIHCFGFNVGLIGGGSIDTYNVAIPSGVNPDANNNIHSWGLMFMGTDRVAFIVRDGLETNKHFICSASFDDTEEYEGTTHEVDATILKAFECTGFSIGHDTLYDTWVIASNNGLFVIYSDGTVKEYPNLKSTAVPFLAQQYVFLAGSCYKLIDDNAIMMQTSSKGAEGQLGVAKHNVRAGEEGTAIILFS